MCADEEKKSSFLLLKAFSMVRAFYAFFSFLFVYFHASQKTYDSTERGLFSRTHNHR